MPKFTLIAEHTNWYTGKVESKVTYEFDADGLSEVLQNTDLFIRGVGYQPDGTLDYVPDEDYYGEPPEWSTPEWDTPQDDVPEDEWTRVRREDAQAEGSEFHSKHYFDTERNK
jgi:hypothetical protein